ncbi:hypothetical protein EIP91_002863 [Steccherinum ochraceum]|uniref:Origin recognition complex subunit 6 n=1 Tax=Steccherinum ochraceum TaxID=92696 RepID=A0A4R0S0J7_9APHY|nr:hypothetical protein EIP91_002863 [Steccherinum ochraceum]
MSRVETAALKRLCSKPETLAQAQTLLNQARLKTASGSGYDLGQGASGLYAICAYLASQLLGNDDVKKGVAQNASCLAPKVFDTTLSTVRAALFPNQKRGPLKASGSQAKNKATYVELVKRFGWSRPEFVIECLEETEEVLSESKELKGKLAPPNTAVTIVVLCWVTQILGLKKARPVALQEEFGITKDDFMQVYEALESTCDVMKKELKEKVADLKKQNKAQKSVTSLDASPSKSTHQLEPAPRNAVVASPPKALAKSQSRTLPRSPSKSAMKASSVEATPSKTPTHKRKVAFNAEVEDDDAMDGSELDSPTRKKRKVSGSSVAASSPFPTPAKRLPALDLTPGIRTTASSSRVMLEDIPESHDETTEDAVSEEQEPEEEAEESRMPVDVPLNPVTPAPMTPRRPRKSATLSQPPTTPSDYYATPSRTIKKPARSQSRPPAEEEDEEAGLPRRYRPVLLGYKQWYASDPRLERELKLAEAAKKNRVEKFGHPFEHLRAAAIEAGVA